MESPLPSLSAPVDDPGEGLSVAVIGGGAVGATTAYDLARRGASVTLFEADAIGSGATYHSAGICHDAYADPTEAAVAGEAIDRFRQLAGDDTFEFAECPYVWLAQDGDDERIAAVREGIRQMQEQGVVALEADADTLAERFPAFETDGIAVAGIAGAAGYVDPVRYTACLAAAARGEGAEFRTETRATIATDPLRVRGDEELSVDAVVVAAGAATPSVLEPTDATLAVAAYGTQAVLAAGPAAELMWHDLSAGCYGRPHEDGLVLGDGVTGPLAADADPPADDEVTDRLLEYVEERLEPVTEAEHEWTGLCTATPDGRPLVGEVTDDVYVATGFEGQGILRAPSVGQRLADQVCSGPGIEAYDPTRFEGDETVPIETAGPPG